MTTLAHAAPAVRRSEPPRARTAPFAAGHTTAALGIAIVVGLVVLGLVVLAAAGADTAGRLPHPQPLPAPSAPSFSGS